MRAFFTTLLLLATVFCVYDYFYAPSEDKLIFERRDTPTPTTPPPVAQPPAVAAQSPSTAAKPAPSTTRPTVPPGFTPPSLPTLEAITHDWTEIPQRAFPRSVELRKPVTLQLSAGSAILNAGTTVTALSSSNGTLTVAPAPTSPARGSVAVVDTDFPDQIRSSYETWKQYRIHLALENWQARQQPGIRSRPNLEMAVDDAGKPLRNSDGTYELLLTSIRRGQVNDIDERTISRWGDAQAGTVDGASAWLVNIDFISQTIFGPIPTQAQAQIVGGTVIRWIYTGSREEVQ